MTYSIVTVRLLCLLFAVLLKGKSSPAKNFQVVTEHSQTGGW